MCPINKYFILIFAYWYFFIADILLIIGNCIGLYFTFKNRKESQPHIKTGIIVGLSGSVLSLLLISISQWILYSVDYGFDFILFLDFTLYLLVNFAIMYILVGIILGYLFGSIYRNREE